LSELAVEICWSCECRSIISVNYWCTVAPVCHLT